MSQVQQTAGTAEQIRVSAIQDLPVQVKNPSKKLISIIYSNAKNNPEEKTSSPILVGRVDSVYYAMTDSETITGFRKAGVSTISAFVTEYTTISDLLVAHVHKNFHPQSVDPLRLRQVVEYLTAGKEEDIEAVCSRLWLEKRPKLYDTVRANLTTQARDTLLELVDEISTKVYSVVTPTYYVTLLAKIATAEQPRAATQIKSFILSKTYTDEKFSWPTFDAIVLLLREFEREPKKVPTKDKVADIEKVTKDINKANRKKEKAEDTAAAAAATKKASKYVSSDPNLIFVPIKGAHPDLLFNKKTGRVAVAKEKNETYTITDDLGVTTQVLPNHVTEYLGVEDANSVCIHKYASLEKMQEAVAKLKNTDDKKDEGGKGGRYVLLSLSKRSQR